VVGILSSWPAWCVNSRLRVQCRSARGIKLTLDHVGGLVFAHGPESLLFESTLPLLRDAEEVDIDAESGEDARDNGEGGKGAHLHRGMERNKVVEKLQWLCV